MCVDSIFPGICSLFSIISVCITLKRYIRKTVFVVVFNAKSSWTVTLNHAFREITGRTVVPVYDLLATIGQRPLTYHVITEEHIAIDKKENYDNASYINRQAINIV